MSGISVCPGSGKRVAAPVTTTFRDEKCPCCNYYAEPVKKYGDWYIRSHRPKVRDDYA